MNKRILELAEQAEKLADEETKAFTDDTGQWVLIWNEVYDKKFAELIVRECIDQIDDGNSDHAGGNREAIVRIKEHFGVE